MNAALCTLLGSVVLILGCIGNASADPITFRFGVHITSSTGPAEHLFDVAVPVGSHVTGTITFDTQPPTPSNIDQFVGAPYGLTLDIGSGIFLNDLLVTWSFIPPSVPSSYRVGSQQLGVPDLRGYQRIFGNLIFRDPGATGVAPHLPVDPAVLLAFPEREFAFRATEDIDPDVFPFGPFDFQFSGTIDSLTLEKTADPIPEPSTLLLVAVGVGARLTKRAGRLCTRHIPRQTQS